jgi:hypothetical protein
MGTELKYKVGDRIKVNKTYPDKVFRNKEGVIKKTSTDREIYPYEIELSEYVDGVKLLHNMEESELTPL